MEPIVNSDVRQLCRAVLIEPDSARTDLLLQELFRLLDERLLLASLF